MKNQIKKIAKGILKCGWPFIRYNYLASNVKREKGCFFYPYRGSIVRIDDSAKMVIKGDLQFNAGKYKSSRAEAYLILDRGAVLTFSGDSRINYGSTVHICQDAVCSVGTMTTNVGLNIQCYSNIEIGEDCMFGRNVTIFDSSYHPTGISEDSMQTNTRKVTLGNHVWVGAHAFIMQGTVIGDGSMVGSGAYIRGEYGPAVTVLAEKDEPSLTDTMWARSMNPADIKYAVHFYKSDAGSSAGQDTGRKYYDQVCRVLEKAFPEIDFANEKELVKNHVMDSLAIMTAVSALTEEFGIEVPYYEISARNFDSAENIAALVGRRLSGGSGRPGKEITAVRQDTEADDAYEVGSKDTLIEYVKAHAEHNPRKLAVISEGEGYTYAKLYENVQRYSSFLRKKGLIKGDRVVVKSIQSVKYIIIYLAVHYCGGVITTVEKASSNGKVLETAELVSAKMVICDDPEGITPGYIYVDSMRIFEDLAAMQPEPEAFPGRDDSADILFTTGTTGKSKGVELSHIAVIAGAENIAYGCRMGRDTVLVVPNPLSHSNAIKNMAACFITGCTFYVLDGITDLNAYFHALDYSQGRVATVLPPAAIRTLFQLAKGKLAEYADKLDYLMAATAPLPEPDRETLRNILPKTRLYNHYGCSESSSICIYDFNKYAELKNCAGKAMPHSHVFFVDDNRREIQSSERNIGLLAVKGDATMKGYFNEPELTREILVDGVIYTKDMGYIDKDGFVFILGRNDDIINVGGLKVSPLDVEAAALAFEGVDDCICIGVDDKITGEALKLLVVSGSGVDVQALKLFLSGKLDPYKVPKQYETVGQIERTYNGKLNRKHYRQPGNK